MTLIMPQNDGDEFDDELSKYGKQISKEFWTLIKSASLKPPTEKTELYNLMQLRYLHGIFWQLNEIRLKPPGFPTNKSKIRNGVLEALEEWDKRRGKTEI